MLCNTIFVQFFVEFNLFFWKFLTLRVLLKHSILGLLLPHLYLSSPHIVIFLVSNVNVITRIIQRVYIKTISKICDTNHIGLGISVSRNPIWVNPRIKLISISNPIFKQTISSLFLCFPEKQS